MNISYKIVVMNYNQLWITLSTNRIRPNIFKSNLILYMSYDYFIAKCYTTVINFDLQRHQLEINSKSNIIKFRI